MADLTPKEILEGARNLIRVPQLWVKGELSNGGRYCALGAISKFAVGRREYNVAPEAEELLRSVLPEDEAIMDFNDKGTHRCVLVAFDAAIEKAGADD